MFIVVAKAREHGEISGGDTPTGVRVKRSSSRPALAYLLWYVDAVVSRPEIDANAEHSRSHHDVISTALHIERRAVGSITFVEGDATSCVVVDGSVADGTEGGAVGSKRFRVPACMRREILPRLQAL
jgi:hypothetical protein